MNVRVFIDGAAGTTGLEIADRLSGRTEIDFITLDDTRRKDAAARREALNDADFVILCLPDDAAREAVSLIDNDRTRVIDASTAHRVADGWTYGMAELEPSQPGTIATAMRVSNPGCYPTGFLALVRPLVRAGLIPHEWPVSVNAVSGYSGGGKAMIAAFENGETDTAWLGYGLSLAHKHVPEMQRHARLAHPPLFQPSVARTYRGMVVEVPLPLFAFHRRPSLSAIEQTLREAYRESPVVRVLDGDDSAIPIEADAGTDRLSLRVFGNMETGQARLIATLDNLGKGAAGAAVQNFNLMAGFDQTAGLTL
ncbi:N-acetyl-gamma-glutamyl-phosphate reductase [Sphingomonas sp. Leaf24]|uniref:N-acetyl-gamma-glutamyl-phosphate reductase n=1 Tax=unclassified Sphingomonas TaxID=196159 RepID=UPI0006FD978D|nr:MULTISPECIES: N-acetyl-gamma-glutamyl-phosphate reductase [unclassified Sphingomonas]KQM18090.1 N-acetyl-gamma-glutamyl-phosphate reductase [Sphingomonas sp. Leaf5]KQM77482.1 N-acetyl-gamma-glutamyl-phosphate reductase [Sphingomonas sp. Leaf22]KQM89071.1 N-acetyl-gamma-glutamyl-phosphate reductase [Sphingomonas sp. Leaf24]